MARSLRGPALAFLLLAALHAPLFAEDEFPGMWSAFSSLISAAFSFGTTGLIMFAVWRLIHRMVAEFVGDRVAHGAAIFCCLLVLSAGLRVADKFLTRCGVPLAQAVSNGIVATVSAVVGPSALSPMEYLTLLGLALFAIYWMLTRFPAKISWAEVQQKIEALAERVRFTEK